MIPLYNLTEHKLSMNEAVASIKISFSNTQFQMCNTHAQTYTYRTACGYTAHKTLLVTSLIVLWPANQRTAYMRMQKPRVEVRNDNCQIT